MKNLRNSYLVKPIADPNCLLEKGYHITPKSILSKTIIDKIAKCSLEETKILVMRFSGSNHEEIAEEMSRRSVVPVGNIAVAIGFAYQYPDMIEKYRYVFMFNPFVHERQVKVFSIYVVKKSSTKTKMGKNFTLSNRETILRSQYHWFLVSEI